MLPRGFGLFQQTREETLRLADGLTGAECVANPADGGWSPGEILDHLILSEGVYRATFLELIELDRAGKRPVVHRTFRDMDTTIFGIPKPMLPMLTLPFTMFNMFVPAAARELFMTSRIAKAKNPKAATPSKGRPLDELRAGLEAALNQTRSLFESNPNANYPRMRFSHPMLGYNDLTGLLRLLALHEQRHQTQFRETVASLRAQGTKAAALAPSVTR